MKKQQKTDPAVKNQSLALPEDILQQFEQDQGQGLEGITTKMLAIPFLAILQKNSPQCDKENSKYVKGAEPGDFFNTVTYEFFSGKTGILVVPAYVKETYVEWVSREQGGGYRGECAPEDIERFYPGPKQSLLGKYVLPSGNYLTPTHQHYVIQVLPQNFSFVVLSLSATQLKVSRHWATKMKLIMIDGPKGKKISLPSFACAYRLTTVTQSNEKGSWKGLEVKLDHILTDAEVELYNMAKAFKNQVLAGQTKIEQGQEFDEAPF